jgi:hypothetical protein
MAPPKVDFVTALDFMFRAPYFFIDPVRGIRSDYSILNTKTGERIEESFLGVRVTPVRDLISGKSLLRSRLGGLSYGKASGVLDSMIP